MSNKAIDLAATPRTEFGKGAARRARRAGLIPESPYFFTACLIEMATLKIFSSLLSIRLL